jgi:hypothetical protein
MKSTTVTKHQPWQHKNHQIHGPKSSQQTALQSPDLIQQVQFTGGVIAQIADNLSHDVPVLLFNMGAIVLIAWPRPGEGRLVFLAPAKKLPVDELRAVITINA